MGLRQEHDVAAFNWLGCEFPEFLLKIKREAGRSASKQGPWSGMLRIKQYESHYRKAKRVVMRLLLFQATSRISFTSFYHQAFQNAAFYWALFVFLQTYLELLAFSTFDWSFSSIVKFPSIGRGYCRLAEHVMNARFKPVRPHGCY